MLNRTLVLGTLAAGLTFFAAAPGGAQAVGFLGGGVTVPTGDFGDAASVGWLVGGGLGTSVGSSGNVSLIGEGLYGGNDFDPGQGSFSVFGGMAHVEYLFNGAGEPGPWVLGGIGGIGLEADPDATASQTDWQFAVNVGGGYSISLGESLNGWGAARYLHGFDEATFVNIQAGISIPLGGGDGM